MKEEHLFINDKTDVKIRIKTHKQELLPEVLRYSKSRVFWTYERSVFTIPDEFLTE